VLSLNSKNCIPKKDRIDNYEINIISSNKEFYITIRDEFKKGPENDNRGLYNKYKWGPGGATWFIAP